MPTGAARQSPPVDRRHARVHDVEDFVENDLAFHGTIAVAAGNGVVTKLLESLSGRTIRARIWRGIIEGGAIDRTVAEHQAICDAIERRSPELARAWMTAHIASVEAWCGTRWKRRATTPRTAPRSSRRRTSLPALPSAML